MNFVFLFTLNFIEIMKKFLLLIIITFSFISLRAQSYNHHEFTLSYGVLTPDRFYTFKSSILDDQLPDSRYIRDNYKSSGNVFLTYRFVSLNEFLMWGGTVGYGVSSSEVYYLGQKQGVMNRQFMTGAFELQYRYVNDGAFQMYSGIGVGLTVGKEQFTTETEGMSSDNRTMILPGYQINLAGVRFGKRLGVFLELGYGYKGIMNVGIAYSVYKFGNKKY